MTLVLSRVGLVTVSRDGPLTHELGGWLARHGRQRPVPARGRVPHLLRLFERIFVLPPEEEIVAQATEPEPRIVATVGVLAAAVLAAGLLNAVLVREVLLPAAERLVG